MKNTITNSLLALAVGSFMFAGSAVAQNGAGPGVNDPGHPRVNEINQREQNQQGRIAQGLENGTMTGKQAERIEGREAHIARQERRDMRADGGHLTKQDQRQLNRELNSTSRQIYRDKH